MRCCNVDLLIPLQTMARISVLCIDHAPGIMSPLCHHTEAVSRFQSHRPVMHAHGCRQGMYMCMCCCLQHALSLLPLMFIPCTLEQWAMLPRHLHSPHSSLHPPVSNSSHSMAITCRMHKVLYGQACRCRALCGMLIMSCVRVRMCTMHHHVMYMLRCAGASVMRALSDNKPLQALSLWNHALSLSTCTAARDAYALLLHSTVLLLNMAQNSIDDVSATRLAEAMVAVAVVVENRDEIKRLKKEGY